MTDYDRILHPGEQQIIRRGAKPAEGWVNRGIINLDVGQTALLTGSDMPRPIGKKYPVPAPPEPDPPPSPPTPPTQLGYAGLYNSSAGVAGGGAGTLMEPTNWTELKAAIESGTSPRRVKPTSSAIIDGGGATATAKVGGMTLDFINHTRSLRKYNLILKSDDIIVRNMKGRPSYAAGMGAASACIMLNPGTSGTMSGILIENNHLAWGFDVCGNHFNAVTDVTWQYNIIGPGLISSSSPGYGFSMHGDSIRHERITVARNLFVHNPRRNLRAYAVDGVDFVNNVVYNWDDKAANANPIGGNWVGNMFKKGPGTQGSNELFASELFGVDTSYHANSVYWDDNLLWSSANGVLTPSNTFASGVQRGTPYDGGLHNITATAASLTLLATVVSDAGTPGPDSLETALKADVTAGTWPGDYYGIIAGTIPPSWP